MEKRRFPRQIVLQNSGLSAKLILAGGSLLESTSPRTIEIGAVPLDISRGGIGLTLKLDVPWVTLTPQKKVSLLLNVGSQVWLLPAIVVRHETESQTIALEFANPLESLSPFLTPKELQ
ncbi:MAG: PilZ domain-containing protein [Deltaproteobacteria bacterium]|nr:PilZ domain-containing protein [Deltaproteobacteria bacterium]MBI4197172.1 PilZ domain-containing protein [Deltaproteobacteria bacterium]